ncbi:hypothetical protein [Streptomyces sp. NPDC057052]|uniref:hypothetical protein n=1 Tax=Streptomyces sp. NPDC057052 TaxID=3346010 RepID=UPI00363FC253
MRLSFSRKRLFILLACVFVVAGAGLGIGWAIFSGNDGPPECAKHGDSMSGTTKEGRRQIIECSARVSEWCHSHHPEDPSDCTRTVTNDGDDRNVGKNKNPARDTEAAPSVTLSLTPLQQAFEKNRRALYDWYEMGLEPIDIKITKMELKPDDHVYITVNLASDDGHGEGKDAALSTFNSYHQEDFQTTLKHMTELKQVKGIKTFYSDGKPIHAPDLQVNP